MNLLNLVCKDTKKTRRKMRGSEFVFESVDLLYYGRHKTRLRKGKSYIKSPE